MLVAVKMVYIIFFNTLLEILILIHGVMYIDSVANNYSQTVFLRKNIELDSFMISYDVIRVENVNEVIAPPEEIAGLNKDASVPQTPLRDQKQIEKAQSPPKAENMNEKKNEESTVESTTIITNTTTTITTTDKPTNTTTTNNNNNKRNNRNKYRNKRNNNTTTQQQQQPPPPSPLSPSQPLPPSTNNNNQPPSIPSTTISPKQQQQQSKPKSRHNNNINKDKSINNKDNNREKNYSKVNSVVIKNLASTVKEETLKETLNQFGEVKNIKIIPSITSHIAFVDFSDEKGKNAVLEFVKSNKLTIEGRDLNVEEHRNLNNHGHYQRRRY